MSVNVHQSGPQQPENDLETGHDVNIAGKTERQSKCCNRIKEEDVDTVQKLMAESPLNKIRSSIKNSRSMARLTYVRWQRLKNAVGLQLPVISVLITISILTYVLGNFISTLNQIYFSEDRIFPKLSGKMLPSTVELHEDRATLFNDDPSVSHRFSAGYLSSPNFTSLNVIGHVGINVLLKLLRQAGNIEALLIDNKDKRFCSTNEITYGVEHFKGPVILKNARTLTLNGFTSCIEVYNYMANNLILPNLNAIYVCDSVIKGENSKYLQNLLTRLNGPFLSSIVIKNTEISTSTVFSQYAGPMHAVRELKFVNAGRMGDSRRVLELGKNFCKLFPNIQKLDLEKSTVSYEDFLNLLSCTSLKQLSLSVGIQDQMRGFKVSRVSNSLPNLEYFRVVFYKKLCGDSLFRIEETKVLRKDLKEFQVLSNCKTEFDNIKNRSSERLETLIEEYDE